MYVLSINSYDLITHYVVILSHTPHTVYNMESFNNDIILRITPYLDSQDLLNLALTCRRFGCKGGYDANTKPSSTSDSANYNNSCTTLSLMEQAAKRIINNATEEEILPINGETWLDLLYELELRRAPLAFDRLLDRNENDIEYKDGNKHHVTTSSEGWRTAVSTSNCIMRDGKHYANLE